MKIFLSWSGERSQKVAALLNDWLRCVVQAAQPWFSPDDIDMGSIWFSQINQQLATMSNGIICLTRTNINKPWILFEAGALAKGLDSSRVFTFLIEIETKEILDPLAQFNHTLPEKESMRKLIKNINSGLGENKISDNILHKVFETNWPYFHETYNQIIQETPDEDIQQVVNQEDILGDVKDTLKSIERRMRNIEGQQNNESINIIESGVFKRKSTKENLRVRVRNRMAQGMSDEEIVKFYSPVYRIELIESVILEERSKL